MGRKGEDGGNKRHSEWVTYFIEVLILHSNSADGITGADELVLQRPLLLQANLKVIDEADESHCEAAASLSRLIRWRLTFIATAEHLSDYLHIDQKFFHLHNFIKNHGKVLSEENYGKMPS